MKSKLNDREIKKLYIEEHKLIREIAAIMQCSETTIQAHLKRMNVETTRKRLGRGIDKLANYKEKNKNIHISNKSRLDFERLIFPYVLPSMYYKLKFLDILKAESVKYLANSGKIIIASNY